MAQVDDARYARIAKVTSKICVRYDLDYDTTQDIISEVYTIAYKFKYIDDSDIAMFTNRVLKSPEYRVIDDDRCETKYAGMTVYTDCNDDMFVRKVKGVTTAMLTTQYAEEMKELAEISGSGTVKQIADLLLNGATIQEVRDICNLGKSKNSVKSAIKRGLGKLIDFGNGIGNGKGSAKPIPKPPRGRAKDRAKARKEAYKETCNEW